MRRRILSALCCILLVSVLSITTLAAEIPDLDRKGTISITMTYQGEAVPGGSLTLYRVAEVHVENGADYSFRYTQEYADCQASLANIGSAETAQTLAEYTKKNKISGTEAQIDQNGHVIFQNLELGLYLLIQQNAADGFETVSPFLVSVPGVKEGQYIYDVDGSPKLELERTPTKPTEPPTEPTTPSKLPQTGQIRWPVPILAVCGLACFITGWFLYVSGKKRKDEV